MVHITCQDFDEIINVHEYKAFKDIFYEKYTEPYWEHDVAIAVNSIVSGVDSENLRNMKYNFDYLKTGGKFIGLFPTIICNHEISSMIDSYSEDYDLENMTFFDSNQRIMQKFYNPLHLRNMLKSVGFKISSMEIIFLDSLLFKKQLKELYQIHDENIDIYEILVVCEK